MDYINKLKAINEDAFMYSKNTSLLNEVDNEFKKLIDNYNFNKFDFDLTRNQVAEIQKNITKTINKLFNTNMKFRFIEPYKKDKLGLKNVAYTVVNGSQVKNIVSGVNKIVLEEKNGIYYHTPREIEVYMEISAIRYFLEGKNIKHKDFKDFNERFCTYVLLHEIGHNLFFPIEINVLTGGETPTFEVKYEDTKPVQFSYAKDISNDTNRNALFAKPMIIAMSLFISSIISLFTVARISLGTFAISTTALGYKNRRRQEKMKYNLSERSANQLPALYGYSVELVKFYNMINSAFKMKSEERSNRFLAKAFRGLLYPLKMFIRDYKDYQTDSIDNVIKTLEFEINNKNNPKEIRDELKAQLNEIKFLIKYSKNINTNI